MDTDFGREVRERNRKRYNNMRSLKDIIMAVLILTVGVLMFFGEKFQFTRVLMANKDPMIKYIFGGLCALYGGFRLYRGIKQDY
ncbi:hypothetical protein SAMN05192529_101196 [Arachidicoccus rhizosphaerae]|jgi:hypothetical protein|uniref:Uncharacterized protein n=1 Tax=Arachidicoccus rhizosphaerae TaxID=551991 RepID=A0A1H3VL10_9BACT|nr:hypothetical protein [Arachidicoccus rhizosphaerae]SDZ74828.1 hypothetical protein SAMN05192529_101196 [Arachidicoccus rhizosphaerae]